MLGPRQKRLFLFFLIAILLPAGVLIGLTRRVIRQGEELANSRAADERRRAVEQVRRELTARLETAKLQEINRLIRAPELGVGERPGSSEVVLVTALDGERLVLPWESSGRNGPSNPLFAGLLQKGEGLEFRGTDSAPTIDVDKELLAAARSLREKCEARLMLGRVLVKAGRTKEASDTYRIMLRECGDTADGQGMPFRLYAAERLLTVTKDASAIPPIIAATEATRWIPPEADYLVQSLLQSPLANNFDQERKNIAARIHETEQIAELAKDFHRIRPLADAGWVAYGAGPWLITVTPPAAPLPVLAFVISSQAFAPPLTTFLATDTPESVPVGDGFAGLRLEWQPGRFTAPERTPTALYTAGIALILGTTLLAGYFLLRDMNRELRLAELRTHFVASVSHELRTPLTAIRMFAETLAMGRVADEPTRSEYLDTIINESERLTRLVENVLDFSKIEQGKKVYQMKTTDLPGVVRSAARTMQYPLAQQGFSLKVSIDETVPLLAADADAIEQATLNLLSNAVKYSGSAREIELCLTSANGDAAVTVIDHGLGIAQTEHALVFQQFYRVRSAETESIGGTGLGLTLVKHIAEAHGGRVEVRSAIGEGSTFTIRIPLFAPEGIA